MPQDHRDERPKPTYVPARAPARSDRQAPGVLGIPMAMTDYDGAMDVMDSMIEDRERGWICASLGALADRGPGRPRHAHGAHGVDDDGARRDADRLGGQPARREPARPRLRPRADAPLLRPRRRARATASGSTGAATRDARPTWRSTCARRYPGLQIVGAHSPPFRPLTEAEDERDPVAASSDARPDVIWVGIGVPKQEKWMVRMRERIEAPVMCAVGAAFDFHAGRVSQAPEWMQERGLEWRTGSRRSPAGCCPATCRPTPASSSASRASTWPRAEAARAVGPLDCPACGSAPRDPTQADEPSGSSRHARGRATRDRRPAASPGRHLVELLEPEGRTPRAPVAARSSTSATRAAVSAVGRRAAARGGLPPGGLQLAAAVLGAAQGGAAHQHRDDAQPARGRAPRGSRGGRRAGGQRARSTASRPSCRSTSPRRWRPTTRTRCPRPPRTCSAASTPRRTACGSCACGPSTTPGPARPTSTC